MEQEYFSNKISSEFIIITHDTNCHMITNELGIEPTRFFNKGDEFTSKHSSRVGNKPYGLWAKRSESVISEEIDVSSHIKYFKKLLENKIEIIEKFKKHYQFETVFAIDIETEDAGIGIDLNDAELSFINKISTRYSCSFITKGSIKD